MAKDQGGLIMTEDIGLRDAFAQGLEAAQKEVNEPITQELPAAELDDEGNVVIGSFTSF